MKSSMKYSTLECQVKPQVCEQKSDHIVNEFAWKDKI